MTLEELRKRFIDKYENTEFQVNHGSSFILLQDDEIIFTLNKTRNWEQEDDITTKIGFGGIGGATELGENAIECLRREVMEEIETNIDDVVFANPKKTYIVKGPDDVEEIDIETDEDSPCPIYIVQLELPLRKDKPSSGKTKSCLLLFVFLAHINSEAKVRANADDGIPALISVKGDMLETMLQGNEIVSSNGEDGVKFYWSKYFGEDKRPEKIHLFPKFTPRGILYSGLKYRTLCEMFD